MPDLAHSLQHHDLGHMRIVAGLWGLELTSNEAHSACEELAALILKPKLAAEILDALPSEARTALATLVNSSGRLPWAAFSRSYGVIREMGPGRRDREAPDRTPVSTAEALFYRALLARAFFDTDNGPQEFAYIPDDLCRLIQEWERDRHSDQTDDENYGITQTGIAPLGHPAIPAERAEVLPANDRILDDATTLLAALRLGQPLAPINKLSALLQTAGFLVKAQPQAEKLKAFLEAPRAEALNMLVKAWRSSESFNELRLIPGLICEGEWKNSALSTRSTLLDFLLSIPGDQWWSLAALLRAIRQKYPDFQRPAGDYDSWFIRRAVDGEYLRGFEHWEQVDGELIRFFITDILYWLGLVNLAGARPGGEISAFQLNFNPQTLNVDRSTFNVEENGRIHISSQGRFTVPRTVPRAVRYQLARFCVWDEEKSDGYRYHVTPGSLSRAKEGGLKVENLMALLAKHAPAGIPPSLVKGLKRWERRGTEASAETRIVLNVRQPEILTELRKSKASRFLGEALGPASVVIKPGAQSKVIAALAEMGLLAEDLTKEQ